MREPFANPGIQATMDLRTLFALISFSVFPVAAAHSDSLLAEEAGQSILQVEASKPIQVSKEPHVLFCWSEPDHPEGTHSYKELAHSFAEKLNSIDQVSASPIEGFPPPEQWEATTLVVCNLTENALSEEQFKAIDKHLGAGKGLIVIHQGLVQRQSFEGWSERIGLAFSWESGSSKSKWGQGMLSISNDTSHPILEGFPQQVTMNDELYWNLKRGSKGSLAVLGETLAPANKEKDQTRQWPAFWALEHAGDGRVFCSVIGHFREVENSPFFQLLMMRGIAWCLDEPSRPFTETMSKK